MRATKLALIPEAKRLKPAMIPARDAIRKYWCNHSVIVITTMNNRAGCNKLRVCE